MVEFLIARGLFIGGWFSVLALEIFLREKETHLTSSYAFCVKTKYHYKEAITFEVSSIQLKTFDDNAETIIHGECNSQAFSFFPQNDFLLNGVYNIFFFFAFSSMPYSRLTSYNNKTLNLVWASINLMTQYTS